MGYVLLHIMLSVQVRERGIGGNVGRDIHLLVPTPRREGKVRALWKEGLQENQENVQG